MSLRRLYFLQSNLLSQVIIIGAGSYLAIFPSIDINSDANKVVDGRIGSLM